MELYSFSDYADTDISQTHLKDITLNSTIRKKMQLIESQMEVVPVKIDKVKPRCTLISNLLSFVLWVGMERKPRGGRRGR